MLTGKNPRAAIEVGQMIVAHLNKSDLSMEQLAERLRLKPGAKMINLLTGRHYFPLDLIQPTVEALEMEPAEFTRAVLRQYYCRDSVDYLFKVIGDAALTTSKFKNDEPREKSDKKQSRKRKHRK
ncbi:hypothetical protein E5S70_04975 [Ensifer adhaerens]|uniref:hypothetical protein n=1 Tax=Ensifer canadensis TaxID=555315 RepID=UPI00148F634A|nr:hypothetical protein [Ensifer canadensis]NOV15446.1 hypothetical protein [Ensifer canadensis]